MFRHVRRRDHVFLDVIEAAAMHLPFLAVHPLRQALMAAQPQIKRDEIEG